MFVCSGSFLADYNNKSNLHIAVTDSRGEVVEFDQSGLRRGGLSQSGARTDWSQCLVVNLGETDPVVADMIGEKKTYLGGRCHPCLERKFKLHYLTTLRPANWNMKNK